MDLHSQPFETLLERTRTIASTLSAPNAADVDAQARWPEESIRALQAAGLAGLVVPVEAGGHGLGFQAVTRVCEVLGQACSSTALCLGMHYVGTACLAAKATQAQRKRWLEPIAAGQHITSLALSEPGTGAHFYIPQTTLSPSEEGYIVSGTKSFITNGGHADSYVLSTIAAGNGSSTGELSCVVVDEGTPGLEWQKPWSGMGMRGNSARSVELRDIAITRDHLLGAEGDEIWYVFHVIAPYFLVAMSATYLGIATAALDEVVAHLKTRRYSFGGPSPAHNSVVQRDLGVLWRRLESTRRLIYHAAYAADTGADDALLALCSAKADVAGCLVDVINGAMTLMGGIAFKEHGRMERLLRDSRAADVMAPTTQLLEVWTGRALLDLPLLSE